MAELIPPWQEKRPPSMLAYAGLFVLAHLVAAIALVLLLVIPPPRNSSASLGHLLVLGAGMLVGWIFVRRHKRLFTTDESRRLVVLCSLWVIAFDALSLGTNARVRSLPLSLFLGAAVVALAIDILIVWATFRFAVRKMMINRVAAESSGVQ